MLKPLLTFLGLTASLSLSCRLAQAQTPVALGPGSSYTENFNSLAGGLPAGFAVYTGATATALGTAATPTLAPGSTTTWASTNGGFKNYASATVGSGTPTASQATAPDRALGVRQTSGLGDPGASFVFKAANTTGRTDVALRFSLQSLDANSPRTTTWTVDYGLGAAPTSYTPLATGTTGGSTFGSTPITVSFGPVLDDQSGPVTIRISALTASTSSGNRPSSAIDDFELTWSTPTATTPTLTVKPDALAFGNQNLPTSSAPQTYSLAGANLSEATTVAATGPFTIAKAASGPFGSTLSYTPAELAATAPVYVQFTPIATGAATGSISHSSAGATTRLVALSGTGLDPTQTVFSFDNCTSTAALSDGWSQYSVSGPQVWGCTPFGHSAGSATASAPNGVQINGYASGNVENEDWFISPAFDLSSYNFPLLSFWSRTAFNGPALQLRVSTNYSGTGAPSAATWTALNVQFPAGGSDAWTHTAGVNLAAFKGAQVYVAFVYTSTSSAAARWTLDDIALTNSATPPAPTLLADATSLAFGYVAAGTSATRPLQVTGNDLTGPVTLTSSSPLFTLSKNGTAFSSTLTLTPAEVAAAAPPVTVRFQPTAAFATYSATLSISTPGAAPLSVALSGDTYDTNKTLEVVNWNLEWFGSTQAGLGPTNKDLQQANISTIATYLGADVYALEEVVDVARLQGVVAQLNAATGHPYAYMVSDFGSYGDSPSDPDHANAQKLAFVYRTDVVSNPTFQGLLRCTEQAACPAYNAWAGGRFPYLMHADVTLDGVTKPVNFIVIHAKANATATSAGDYARRQLGATLLKNLLDTQYAGQSTLIVGDYNDVLAGTIATGTPAVSSYDAFVQDSAYYKSITLPLARAGARSTVSFPTVIDNAIASGPLASYYLSGTAAIRTDAAALVANYGTTTTDHYPVFTRYSFAAPDLVVSAPNQAVPGGTYNSLTITGSGSATLQGPVAVVGAVAVQSGGQLATNCQLLSGVASFTVAAGATLGICDAAGLSPVGTATNPVRLTGSRSLSPDATYVYNGTSAQVTGAGLPGQVRALTTTNANTLTLSQPLAVAQTLTVGGSGNLVLGGQALTLLSDARGTALVVNSGSGIVQGPATVQRYLAGGLNAEAGYRHLSAPVANSTVADLGTASFAPTVNAAYNTSATPGLVRPFPTVYGYDETRVSLPNNLTPFDRGFYSPQALTDALQPGRGYAVNLRANQVVDFQGTLTNGLLSQPLSSSRARNADGGWQLLGNPYPSPLDWSTVAPADRAGLESAIYVYQSTGQYAGQYRAYVNGQGGDPVLPLGQGFFVRVQAGQSTGVVNFRNSQRVTSYAPPASGQRTAAAARPRLALSLAGASGSPDALYLYAEAGASTGFDQQQDAAKLPNTTGLNLAALTPDGQPLSIQALPSLVGRVALRVLVPAAGTYTLRATDLLNLPAGTEPVLEDTKTGQRTPLAAGGSGYTFSVAASDNPDGRFWLSLSATPLATAAGTLPATLGLYPNPVGSTLRLEVPETSSHLGLQVLSADGRLVLQGSGSAEQLNQQLGQQVGNLSSGLYLLRVTGAQQTYVARFQKL